MTRCLLSETHFSVNTLGEVNPCCRYTPSHDVRTFLNKRSVADVFSDSYLVAIRERLKNGIKDEGCYHCWDEEDHGVKSLRQIHNSGIDETGISGNPINDIKSLEIAFSNHCNMKCRHCKTASSSRWKTDDEILGRWVPDKILQEPDVSSFKLDQLKNLKHIKILGGEPLLSKAHTQFMKVLDENNLIQNLSFDIITNGSVFPNDIVLNGWKKAKAVTIVVSVDDIESYFNYFRSDGDFDILTENMRKFENLDFENITLYIHTVVNVLNVYRISQVFKYFCSHFEKWNMYFDKIHSPDYLRIEQWDKHSVQSEYDEINKLITESKSQSELLTLTRLLKMLDSIKNEAADFRELFDINFKLDNSRNTSLLDIHPIFKNYKRND